jgi:hypothetical protein
MGIDTAFFQTEVVLGATKNVKNANKKITTRYLANHKKYKAADSDPAHYKDWTVQETEGDIEEGDTISLIIDHRAHRGSAADFVPNLLLLLEAAKHYGFEPFNRSLPYFTSWGDALSGVLRVSNEFSVTLTEVLDDGTVEQEVYTLDDVDAVTSGQFDKLDRRVVLYTPPRTK